MDILFEGTDDLIEGQRFTDKTGKLVGRLERGHLIISDLSGNDLISVVYAHSPRPFIRITLSLTNA